MAEHAVIGDRRDLAASLREAGDVVCSLCDLLQSERDLIKAGRYKELAGLRDAKRTLTISLTGYTEELQAAGWDVASAQPEAAGLAGAVARLAEAIRADMGALQQAMVAADRVAQVIGFARSAGGGTCYGSGGRLETAQGRAMALRGRV